MKRRGFTLVELAIVLVIIGLILGAILKGQELINNAKMKRLYNQYREVLAAVYTYYDRYGAFPGDDPTAATRWPGAPYGDGDGLIGGFNINCGAGSSGESCYLWRHLKLANIITGPLDNRAPKNPYGGSVGVGYTTVQTLTTNWIGFNNIPGDVCVSIDQQYDDGVFNTGSIRGSGDYVTNPNANYYLYIRL